MSVLAVLAPIFPVSVFLEYGVYPEDDLLTKLTLLTTCAVIFEVFAMGCAWFISSTVREIILLKHRKVAILKVGVFGSRYCIHPLDGLIPPFSWSGHRRTTQHMYFVDLESPAPKYTHYFIDWRDSHAWKFAESRASRAVLEDIFISNRKDTANKNAEPSAMNSAGGFTRTASRLKK